MLKLVQGGNSILCTIVQFWGQKNCSVLATPSCEDAWDLWTYFEDALKKLEISGTQSVTIIYTLLCIIWRYKPKQKQDISFSNQRFLEVTSTTRHYFWLVKTK